MVRYKCVEKANILYVWSSFHVLCFKAAAFVCPAIQTNCFMSFGWEEHMSCPFSPLAWLIFLQLGFLPWCSLPACVCLAQQQCCGMATVSIIRSTSLFLPHKRRAWGKGRRGVVGSWALSKGHEFTVHWHQEELVCFLPFFQPCSFLEIQGILNPPCTFPNAPKHTHKCIHIHHTFAVQYPRTLVLSDSGSA